MTTSTAPTAVQSHNVPRLTLRSPADLIAATPYLLGFHPADSVVVVAFRGSQLAFAARSDLPDPGDPPGPLMEEIVDTVLRQDADAMVIIGYGPAATVEPLLHALRDAAERRGRFVKDVLRVDDGRWWSCVCDDPECCPPEGTPIDLAASEVSAWCAFEGFATAADREEVARQVAPVGGPARAAMTEASDRAQQRFAEWLLALPEDELPERVLAEGTAVVKAAITRYEDGGRLDDDELAWLGILLIWLPVRDAAWAAISTEQPHLRLWTDVTQRIDPVLVPAPACLLAFTAWRGGNGVLAGLALERALSEDSSYTMAQMLLEGLRRGKPPAELDDWGTPEWERRVERDPRQRRGRSAPPAARSRKSRRGRQRK